MHHAGRSHTLSVLVVSEDRKLTRELSCFLNMAGYHTLEAAQPQVALRAVETGAPHVALVDARLGSRDHWALCRLLCESRSPGELLKFLVVNEPDDVQLQEALDAGIDDVFLVPLCYGELLARLRTAARVLEYDRRAALQELVDAATGLPGRAALVADLRRRWSHDGEPARLACVTIDVDFFAAFAQAEGQSTATAILTSVAEELQKLRGDAGLIACYGRDRFAAVLSGADADAGCEWAQRVSDALAEKTFAGKANCRLTVSCGVADSQSADSAEQLVEQALAALASAKTSGRNCVVRWNEFADESLSGSTWSTLLDRTVAADVLTPCAVFLQAGESIGHAAELFGQTQLEAIAVVDVGGKFVGLCKSEQVAGDAAESHAVRLVRDVMTTDVRRFGRHEELTSLMEFFNSDPLAWAAVVHDGRPVGLLSCDSILELSQPVSPFDVAAQPRFTDTSDYLLVAGAAAEKWNEPA